MNPKTPSSTLVVYHSRTGHTRRVARALATALNADLEEIRPLAVPTGALGYAQCAIEAIAACRPALRPPVHDPARYDLVVIGSPVWFWSLSSPVRAWLAHHRPLKAKVAFFCTMGGSGAARVFGQMRALAGQRPLATLAMTEREVNAGSREPILAMAARLAGRPAAAPRAKRAAAGKRPPAKAAA